MKLIGLEYENVRGKFFKRRSGIAFMPNNNDMWYWYKGTAIAVAHQMESDWYECDTDGNRLPKYPLWVKSIHNGAILKFTKLKEATIVVEGDTAKQGAGGFRELVGFYSNGWAAHNKLESWVQVNEPIIHNYPVIHSYPKWFKSIKHGHIVQFEGVKSGTIIDSGPNTQVKLGHTSDTFIPCTDETIWVEVEEPKLDDPNFHNDESLWGTDEYIAYWDKLHDSVTDVYRHVCDDGKIHTVRSGLKPSDWSGRCLFSLFKDTTTEMDEWMLRGRYIEDIVDTPSTSKSKCTKFKVGDEVRHITTGRVAIIKRIERLDYVTEIGNIIHHSNEGAYELITNENKIEENDMKKHEVEEVAAAVIGTLCRKEAKVKKVKTDFEARKKFMVAVYGRDGKLEETMPCTKKEHKDFFQVPANIGKKLVMLQEVKATTTSVPTVEIK